MNDIEKLEKLHSLKVRGILTEEEFLAQKKKLLTSSTLEVDETDSDLDENETPCEIRIECTKSIVLPLANIISGATLEYLKEGWAPNGWPQKPPVEFWKREVKCAISLKVAISVLLKEYILINSERIINLSDRVEINVESPAIIARKYHTDALKEIPHDIDEVKAIELVASRLAELERLSEEEFDQSTRLIHSSSIGGSMISSAGCGAGIGAGAGWLFGEKKSDIVTGGLAGGILGLAVGAMQIKGEIRLTVLMADLEREVNTLSAMRVHVSTTHETITLLQHIREAVPEVYRLTFRTLSNPNKAEVPLLCIPCESEEYIRESIDTSIQLLNEVKKSTEVALEEQIRVCGRIRAGLKRLNGTASESDFESINKKVAEITRTPLFHPSAEHLCALEIPSDLSALACAFNTTEEDTRAALLTIEGGAGILFRTLAQLPPPSPKGSASIPTSQTREPLPGKQLSEIEYPSAPPIPPTIEIAFEKQPDGTGKESLTKIPPPLPLVTSHIVTQGKSQCSMQTTLILCLCFGFLGAHRLYAGRGVTGLLQFFTLGGFGIWVLVDFILIVSHNFKDEKGIIIQ